jgi:hypothetical protein
MLIRERLEPIHLDERFTMRTHDAHSMAMQSFVPTLAFYRDNSR